MNRKFLAFILLLIPFCIYADVPPLVTVYYKPPGTSMVATSPYMASSSGFVACPANGLSIAYPSSISVNYGSVSVSDLNYPWPMMNFAISSNVPQATECVSPTNQSKIKNAIPSAWSTNTVTIAYNVDGATSPVNPVQFYLKISNLDDFQRIRFSYAGCNYYYMGIGYTLGINNSLRATYYPDPNCNTSN